MEKKLKMTGEIPSQLAYRKLFWAGLIFIITLFSINLVSSFEFDNVISDTQKTFDNKDSLDISLLEKYPPLEVVNFFDLGDTLAEAYISEHTEICGGDCSSNIQIKQYKDGVLIDGIRFYRTDKERTLKEIPYTIYIKTGETITDKLVSQYERICKEETANETIVNVCNWKSITKNETIPIWEKYNMGAEVSPGTYEIKIEGQKDFYESIDWQVSIQGQWTESWADWGVGGTITYDGDYVIHTFLANGTFNVTSSNIIDVLVVAGGGSGGAAGSGNGGGGGAGGLIYNTSYTLTAGNYVVTIGEGGVYPNGVGGNSNFSVFNAIGGGNGAEAGGPSAAAGGSGGGGSTPAPFTGGVGTTNQGNAGGTGSTYSAGGGGASQAGRNGDAKPNGGGNGTLININGTAVYYAGGGGGNGPDSPGGLGGGGAGGIHPATGAIAGTDGLGGGGGGASGSSGANGGGGSGVVIIRYLNPITNTSNVTLNTPINNYNSSSSLITFNCSANASGLIGIANISLWHNGTGTWHSNQTNSSVSPITNTTIFTSPFATAEGYIWNCGAGLTNGSITFAYANRTFNIDTTGPVITLNNPKAIEDLGQYDVNQTLNWSIVDNNLDEVWWNYNGTNLSLYGAINTSSFRINGSLYTGNLWANDTLGNIANLSRTWDYMVFVINDTYVSPTFSGITNKFLLQLKTNGTQVTIGNLKYNNTNNVGSITSSGNYYNTTKNQIATLVTSPTNISFFWNITMENGYNFLRASNNQTVNPIVINATCGAGTYVVFNFTLADEISQEKINGDTYNSSIKVDMNLYNSDRTFNVSEFYHEFNKTNPAAICIDNNLSGEEQYSLDIQVQYDALNYSTELYHIERYSLNSSNLYNNITLYDLDTANAQKFRLIARDTSYLPIESLIRIERKYIQNGTFYAVEIPKTDNNGITSASLQLNDVIYNFHIYQNGTLISSFTNVLAICQTPLVTTCEIDFNAFQSEITVPNYEEGDDFNFTLGYNTTSKVVSSQFIIPSGNPGTIRLDVIKEDALGTAVCSDTITSASGTLSCTVPATFKNATILAKVYKNNIEQGKGNIKLDQDSSDIYGVILVMISILVLMTLVGIGLSDNPVITGVFLFVGAVLMTAMNLIQNTGFIGATATILFLAIAIILIIIKAAKRS